MCGGCINVCPKKCISKVKYNNTYCIEVNRDLCIECNLCKQICPVNNHIELNKPFKVYAGWNCNKDIRNKAASGGIATQLYANSLDDYICYGVIRDNHQFIYTRISNNDDLKKVSNSKYAYSDMKDLYSNIKKEVSNNRVLFIGMPCQVYALKSYIGKNQQNLLTIDIVCHGLPEEDSFINYCNYICEKNKLQSIEKIEFRRNNNFDITITDKNNKEKILREKFDPYCIGYHRGIIYRESCYSCKFSGLNRIGDLSLCDYWNLYEYRSHSANGITGILVNSTKGKEFLFKKSQGIKLEEKKISYDINKVMALNKPTPKSKIRLKYEKKIYSGEKFVMSIQKVTAGTRFKNYFLYFPLILILKKSIKRILRK